MRFVGTFGWVGSLTRAISVMLVLLLLPLIGAKDIGQPQVPYVTKYMEHCPASGYVLKKDQQGKQETCYLCFCRNNETALCWPRNNVKCDNEHYQHNVVKRKEKTRVRRSPWSLGGLFSAPAVTDHECKPHKDSKSEGCPPLDWCVGCNVCDCDSKGMWDCHLLSFCTEDDKRKKQLQEMILSTTPKMDKALRKRAREQAYNLTAALVADTRKKHRSKMGKDLRRKYFFKNGTLINQTLFNLRKKIKSNRFDNFNSTLREEFEQYNLKVRNKDPNLREKYQVVTGNQAKKITDANMNILGISDKQTREKMAEKNKQAMNVLAKTKVRDKKHKKNAIVVPAGLQIPDKFKSARFTQLIGGVFELAKEKVKNNISEKVNNVKSVIAQEVPQELGNAEETEKLNLEAKRRRVRKIMKELHGENDFNILNSKPRLRMRQRPLRAAGAFRVPQRRMYAKIVKLNKAKTTENIKVNKKKSDNKLSLNKYLKSNHSRNTSTTSSTVKPQIKKENAKNLKVDKIKLKSKKSKATTKKPAFIKIKKSAQKTSTKNKELKTIQTKVNDSLNRRTANKAGNTISSVRSPSKNKTKRQAGDKLTTKNPVSAAKPKKGNQKFLSKNIKKIKRNHSVGNETTGKATSQIKQKSSPTKSSRKVKRSVENKSPKTTLNVEGIFRRSYRPGETATKYDVLGKQIYTNHNDIKTKGAGHELNYKSNSVLTGSHKIWLQRHRRRRPNATRSKTRVAKVIKPIAPQEQNDTRRLSIPFIRNNRQVPSANPKESRYIPVSNLRGYIHSQNRKSSQNLLVSLLNERIQQSMNIKSYHYKPTTNNHLVTEGPKKSSAPLNAPKRNQQLADYRTKHSQANSDKKSVQKRQKRELREETSSLTTDISDIKNPNHKYKNNSQRDEIFLKKTQIPDINVEAKAMTEATEWHLIPTETNFANQMPTKFSYFKYSVEESTNKTPFLDKSKNDITETVISQNKNTEAKRSVDSHLPIHDVMFSQNLNESNIKTRSVTDAYDKEKLYNDAGETFTMMEGIRDLKKYQQSRYMDDDQMTFTNPISSEIKAWNNQDTSGLPNQVKTPSILDKAVVVVHGENDSSQDNNTTSLTESLLMEPMSFTATEMYVGVDNLLNWMPADSKYIEGDKNNSTEPSVTERNVDETKTTNSPKMAKTNSPVKEMMTEHEQKNVLANKSNNSSQSKVDSLFSTNQTKIKSTSDFNNIHTAKVENINTDRKEKNNTVSPKTFRTHFTAKAIKNNSQSNRFNISTLTKSSFEYEGGGNTSEITSYHYVPLGTLFKNNAHKKTPSIERVEVLVPAIKLKKETTSSTYKNSSITSTEKNNIDGNHVKPKANITNFTVKFDITTENDPILNLEDISNTTTEQAIRFPKKNIKSNEIKKLSLKKYQLKKIVPTLYSNKLRDKEIIIANDTSKTLNNNKTSDFKCIFKNLLNGINIKNKKNKNNKAKRFKILKYLQKFFKTLFTNSDKHNKKNINSTIDKMNMINNLCALFGPCNISVKNDANLQRQIDNLNFETYKMLRSIKIVKGLLKLVDFRREEKIQQYKLKNVRSHFKSDVQKLRAILRDTYLQDDAFKNLTANQRTQIAYIKNNTQHFIQSAAKFTMILNGIINMISKSGQTRNASGKYPKKIDENGDKGSFRRNPMSYKNGTTVVLPLKKLKDLITKYNFVQNTFMRKMFKILSHIFPNNIKSTEPNKNLNVKKNNKTEAIQMYTKNIIQNLQKLRALAQNVGRSVRRKRHIRSDDSLEYMLMMMEFSLKQNQQLDSEPENDGIDLLLDAINSAPDIKAIKKKVLQTNLQAESNTVKEPKVQRYDNTRRQNTDNKFTTLMPSEDSTIGESKTSTSFPDDIFDVELKKSKDDNFTSKMEDSVVNVVDQSDDDEDEDDTQPYYFRKSSKRPTVAKVRPHDHNNKKLAPVQGSLDTAIFLKQHLKSKSEDTTEKIPDHTKRFLHMYMNGPTYNKGATNSLEAKENAVRDGNAQLKGDSAEVDDETISLSEQMPLKTSHSLIEFTTESGTNIIDEPQIKAVPSMRAEWIDETYEELKGGSSTALTEDIATEFISDSTTVSSNNDISGISKEALVPLEVLNFERKMQDVSDRSWLKVLADDYGRDGGALFSVSSKESDSIDKYADDSDVTRA